MSTSDSKPPRPTLSKPEKPVRPVPAPVARPPAPATPAAASRPAAAPPPSNKKPRLRKPRKDAPQYQAPAFQPTAKEETGERLSKRVMQLKGCSRKEAEQYIEAGFVTVNGVVAEEPALRIDRQTVALDPQASLLAMASVTLILNKPPGTTDGLEDDDDDDTPPRPSARGAGNRKAPPPSARSLLSPQNHWAHDPSETRVLKRHFKNLEADIELETGASGLVVFTEDWRTTRKLTEDMATMEHEFLVEVKGEVAPEALKPIGYALKDDRLDLPQVKVSVSSSTPEMSRLRFAIKGSHPGLVAYLCGLANLDILAMRRVRLGRVSLADLPVGQWRFLADYEKF
jgi:23S rRNA pseudouridine2604 synthase